MTEPVTTVPAPLQKRPGLAAVLSIFPGVGHIYDGLYLRGLTFFAIIAGCIQLAQEEEIFGFAVAFFWIFNVVDAYRQATLINYGYATDLGLTDLPEVAKPEQGGLWAGAILIVIGIIGVLERFFHLDLDFLVDLWPFGLVIFGAWLVWSSVRQRRSSCPPTELATSDAD